MIRFIIHSKKPSATGRWFFLCLLPKPIFSWLAGNLRVLFFLLLISSTSLFGQSTDSAQSSKIKTSETIKLDSLIEKVNTGIAFVKFLDTLHDLGIIKLNDPANFIFEFINTGTSPVFILDVQSSCNCATPAYNSNPVKPKEKGSIGVSYRSTIPGRASKSFLVRFSNGQTQVLAIKVHVVTS